MNLFVQIGKLRMQHPVTALQASAGIREFMERKRIPDVREIVGSFQTR